MPATAPVFNMTAIRRLILPAALAVLLVGCNTNTRPLPSAERAAAFSARGDHPAAAREYEALASASAETPVSNPRWTSAAAEWLRAGDPTAAEAALARLGTPLETSVAIDRDLALAGIALLRGEAARGWDLLGRTALPQDAARLDAYYVLRQRLALATNRPLQAIRSQSDRESQAPEEAARSRLRGEFLELLRGTVERGALLDPRAAGRDATARGWLEAAPLAVRAAQAPIESNAAITAAWRKRYPNHPAFAALANLGQRPPPNPAPSAATAANITVANIAVANTPARGAGAAALVPSGAPLPRANHVAVLLPLSGRNAAAGAQLREGILAAHFAEPAATRTPVRFYDTARQSVAEALAAASAAGAAFVIGPLLREEVVAAATQVAQGTTPAVLALNFLPTETPLPGNIASEALAQRFRQFALSPEDEARAVAQRALAEGRRRAVALVPSGEWGARVLAAFRESFESGGGTILASDTLGNRDIAATVQEALRIDDSIARHRRVQAAIDSPLAFTPRRRGDIDFLFTPAQAAAMRQWRAQLRFQGAGDIPAYATSDAYDGRTGADLAGLIFPDMDWMIAPQSPAAAALRAATEAAFGEARSRGRLFAFGHDAWLLQRALREGPVPSAAAPLAGAAGELSIDAAGRVQRSLRWAEIETDSIRLLESPGVPAPRNDGA